MPPLQVIRCPGANSVTLTGKARPGLACERTLSFSPGGDAALDLVHARVPCLVAGGVGEDGPDGVRAGLDLRGRVGGPPKGVEHDQGEILTWEPPHRLAYLWHLGTDRGRATEVEISFAGG